MCLWARVVICVFGSKVTLPIKTNLARLRWCVFRVLPYCDVTGCPCPFLNTASSLSILSPPLPLFSNDFFLFAGKTALHWAAAVDNHQAVQMLIEKGANKDAKDARVSICVTPPPPPTTKSLPGRWLVGEVGEQQVCVGHSTTNNVLSNILTSVLFSDLSGYFDEFTPPWRYKNAWQKYRCITRSNFMCTIRYVRISRTGLHNV